MVAPDNDDPDNPSTLSTHRYKFDHKLNLRNKGKGFAAFSLTFGGTFERNNRNQIPAREPEFGPVVPLKSVI
jgi:hypothetical protein